MPLQQIDYASKVYDQMLQLRLDMLRKPLGLTFSEEELRKEADDIFITCTEDGDVLGCCVLTPIQHELLRLRQMAVCQKSQRKGIGETIVLFAEKLSRDKGYKKIMMHARNSALGFYQKMGYKIVGDEFEEVGLPHHIMEKSLH